MLRLTVNVYSTLSTQTELSWPIWPITLPTELRRRTERVGDDFGGRGFDSHRGQKNFFFTSCGSLIPFTRANAQWVFRGFHIELKFTLQS